MSAVGQWRKWLSPAVAVRSSPESRLAARSSACPRRARSRRRPASQGRLGTRPPIMDVVVGRERRCPAAARSTMMSLALRLSMACLPIDGSSAASRGRVGCHVREPRRQVEGDTAPAARSALPFQRSGNGVDFSLKALNVSVSIGNQIVNRLIGSVACISLGQEIVAPLRRLADSLLQDSNRHFHAYNLGPHGHAPSAEPLRLRP
jgi:hypothetical protein